MALTKEQFGRKRHRLMRDHREWAVRQWERAFCDDWDYEYLLIVLRAKLTTMQRYNQHLSYAMNGPYYARQIRRAIRMIDIVLQNGGNDGSLPHVNMKNRARIPRMADSRSLSETQEMRFDKAWMLLWRILADQSMAWGD